MTLCNSHNIARTVNVKLLSAQYVALSSRTLLLLGADVNYMEDRLSALHIAACKCQTGIAKLLINNKCNVNILTR